MPLLAQQLEVLQQRQKQQVFLQEVPRNPVTPVTHVSRQEEPQTPDTQAAIAIHTGPAVSAQLKARKLSQPIRLATKEYESFVAHLKQTQLQNAP